MSDPSQLPAEVRRLIRAHLGSARQLEILLALRSGRDRTWTADATGRELRVGEAAAELSLRELAAGGLLAEEAGKYRYAPRDRSLASACDALADAYAKRRVRVIEFLYSKPDDAIETLADAFKFRRSR
jgi:hypothetical protein